MRSLSGASLTFVAVLAWGQSRRRSDAPRSARFKAKKAFKAANAAYQQQDYKKAAELYEETVEADPDT